MSPSSKPDKAQVLRETDDAARSQARSFVRDSAHGSLATLEQGTGWPLASRVSLAADTDGVPLILISRLSAHYGALEADGRCSLLLGEAGEGDPLRHPRITVVCLATKVSPELRASAKVQFLQRHPGAEMYADFTDFDFWRLVPQRASLNAGFGRAYALSAEDVLKGRG
jgi:heme iron utilization protein